MATSGRDQYLAQKQRQQQIREEQSAKMQQQMASQQAMKEQQIKAAQERREQSKATAAAKRTSATAKQQIANAFNSAPQNTAATVAPAATSTASGATASTQPAATAAQTSVNESLNTLRAVYNTFNNYTPKTEEEIRAQAEGETKSKYDLLTNSARQAMEKEDLALAQQREGLGTSYDRQRENTDKTYDRNRSAADRQALSRGMQRSSYNNQTLANIDSERAQALRDIDEAQTTAEGNIDAQRAQLASQLAETERSYTQAQADDILARTRELQDQEYERKLKADQIRAELASDLYGKEYQLGRDAITDAFNEKQFAFQQEQAEIQQAQWREQFDYQQKSDDQKIAMQYAMSIIQNGGTPSDDLLARAGLSRSDANAMTQQAAASGGYSGPGKKTTGDDTSGTTEGDQTNDSAFLSNFTSNGNGIYKGTAPTTNTKVPISSNSNKTGNVKTNTVVYIPEQDKYKTAENKTANKSNVDKKQTTWKSSYTK